MAVAPQKNDRIDFATRGTIDSGVHVRLPRNSPGFGAYQIYHLAGPGKVLHDVNLESEHVIRKRSADQPLRIYTHYDYSVDGLTPRQRFLLQNDVIPAAVQYWENTLRVRQNRAPIRLRRKCQDGQIQYNFMGRVYTRTPYCVLSCLSNTMCGEVVIPQRHLEACFSCNGSVLCEKRGQDGQGVSDTDFILYISAVQSQRCHLDSTVAYAAHCQLEKALDRPVAGYINICPRTLSTHAFDLHQTISTVKHEVLHALGFTAGLYAFYRDPSGRPLTPRKRGSNKPSYDAKMGVYRWSNSVVKVFNRSEWRVASGTIHRAVHLVVTPKVKEEARRHYNCSTLEGAELEDQGILGTALTHWEKRVFENEAMTGTYTQNPLFSRITLALMEDTGWYQVNYDNAEDFTWGKNLGCDFVQKSCMDWMTSQKESRKSIHPFCDRPREGALHTECTMNRQSVALCNLVEYPLDQPLPKQYQYFRRIDGIARSDAHQFAGSVALADYCPFIQEFTWKSGATSIRTSRCTQRVNHIERDINYLLEDYGKNSLCFNHNGFFTLQHCEEETSPEHGGSGCHQFSCSNATGLSIIVTNIPYRCYFTGQRVRVAAISKSWLHKGEIICPSCQEICSEAGVSCPAEIPDPYISPPKLPEAPCYGSISTGSGTPRSFPSLHSLYLLLLWLCS